MPVIKRNPLVFNEDQNSSDAILENELMLDEEEQEHLIMKYNLEDERMNGEFKIIVSALFTILTIISFFEFSLNPLHFIIIIDDILNWSLIWTHTTKSEDTKPIIFDKVENRYIYIKLSICLLCTVSYFLFPISDGHWTWLWFLLPLFKGLISLCIDYIVFSLKGDIIKLENTKYKLKGA
ncbi:hypothetical protein K502DRAFT_366806 [Neoconidiobolus thromboides FSU 785]|nr:hypothetical protein K502DRAFT_366806 [Neoconidiobolus thromboides FSU 785]